MDLRIPKVLQDYLEKGGFTLGLSFATFKEISDYFLFDFPITQVNQYIYTLVLLSTLAIFIKRLYGWLSKSDKPQ